jgi:hypothetical protein
MPEGVTTPFPKALYLLDSGAFEKIYSEEERAAVAGLADVYAPLQTGDSVANNPSVLAEAEVILSGWGALAMDGAFLAAAPNLRVVLMLLTPHIAGSLGSECLRMAASSWRSCAGMWRENLWSTRSPGRERP